MILPKTAKEIEGSFDHWIDIDGSVYCIDHRNGHHKLINKAQTTCCGYKYCGIRYGDKNIPKRVHRLVAEAFIPNPKSYTVVGHKNNIKSDNRVENLYWTTVSENTMKAFDDGLVVNDKGYDDSQSKPVYMYDTYTNEKIGEYGSIIEASKNTGLSKTTIARQAKYKRPVRKPYYFRFQDDKDVLAPEPIGMFEYETDKLVDVFLNASDASKKTGINNRTIAQQVSNNRKPSPKHKHNEFYFLKLSSR